MNVHARFEAHDPDKRASRPLTNGESQGATVVPIRHTRLGEPHRRSRFRVKRDPREPLLQQSARALYGKPNLLRIREIHGSENEPFGLDRPRVQVGTRRKDEGVVY